MTIVTNYATGSLTSKYYNLLSDYNFHHFKLQVLIMTKNLDIVSVTTKLSGGNNDPTIYGFSV
jgi:hypothetical protein